MGVGVRRASGLYVFHAMNIQLEKGNLIFQLSMTTIPKGPKYCIDVECVASGTLHSDRVVAQIAVVDDDLNTVLDIYVKPEVPVVSYLTDLTGITKEMIEERGIPLEEALKRVREVIPLDAHIVGWGISQDIKWLDLTAPHDCAGFFNVQDLYNTYSHKFKSTVKYSLEHAARHLLHDSLTKSPAFPHWSAPAPPACIIAASSHSAARDAYETMLLLKLYAAAASQSFPHLLTTHIQSVPMTPAFSSRNPTLEGVCMGHRRLCTCGAPFGGGA